MGNDTSFSSGISCSSSSEIGAILEIKKESAIKRIPVLEKIEKYCANNEEYSWRIEYITKSSNLEHQDTLCFTLLQFGSCVRASIYGDTFNKFSDSVTYFVDDFIIKHI